MKNLFLTDTGKRIFVALLLSDKDTGHIMWHNVLPVRHTGGYFRFHEAKRKFPLAKRLFPLKETPVPLKGNSCFL